jgi:hypothetical protein
MSKQFVKISRDFGFNRNRLLFWEFHKGEDEVTVESVSLHFENTPAFILIGDEVQTFRNWVENEAEPAPETYQHTLYGLLREPQGPKSKSNATEA